ncbi:MAG: ROK family protein [Oscillospiraceae bacterium]
MYYIGIDLGGTNIVAGVLDENYQIINKVKVKTNLPRSAEDIINDMAKVATMAVSNCNITFDDIEWIGVGTPGIANQQTGIVEFSGNLDWHNVPLCQMLSDRLNKKIYMENDANAAAYGEYVAGSAKDANISIMITLGTGVGGGLIINNSIYHGFNFAGAEMGHIVINVDGRQCSCGRKGCLETYASATGLIVSTKEAMQQNKNSLMWNLCHNDISNVNGVTAFDAMHKGDLSAKKVVDDYIKYLGCGIANFINIFQPDILSIGGGICNEGDNLLTPLKEYVAKEIYTRNSKNNTKIVTASLGNDAGIIGAALLGKCER